MAVDKSKYVVLDVETNGLTVGYDLLSISLYMPDTGKKYERYLPPEKNKHVLPEASAINGITDEMVMDKLPIIQEEWDSIVKDFELDKREILHYGKIDQTFIKDYLLSHGIKGFSKLIFHNIKRHFLTNSFSSGEYSKDNLCRGLGIEGVTEVHNGLNDCILEWQLFEKIDGGFVLCLRLGDWQMGMYKLSDRYYIPASRIRYFPNMKYAVNLPDLKVDFEEVFSLELSKKCYNKKDMWFQPAGFASERIIKASLNAVNVEDDSFAKENFKNLELIGKFSYKPDEYEIPVIENSDGTLTAVREEDKASVEEMNRVMLQIKSELPPLFNFVKKEIFQNKPINTQETIINHELKSFGYTDFSNDVACLEMKFSDGMMDDFYFNKYHPSINKHKYQLYILSNGRPTYLLIGGHARFIVLKVTFHVGREAIREVITANRHYDTRIVVQYDQKGKKIKEFSSAKEASEELGVSVGAIRDNCNGRHQLTGGFQFKYKYSDKKIGEVIIVHHGGGNRSPRPRPTRHVLQYDLDGNFIKEYNSAKEASEAVRIHVSKISMVCTGKRNKAAGFDWKYKDYSD